MPQASTTTPQSKAWDELHVAARDLVRYLELHAAGVMSHERDPNARVILSVDDALRQVRFHGKTAGVPA